MCDKGDVYILNMAASYMHDTLFAKVVDTTSDDSILGITQITKTLI